MPRFARFFHQPSTSRDRNIYIRIIFNVGIYDSTRFIHLNIRNSTFRIIRHKRISIRIEPPSDHCTGLKDVPDTIKVCDPAPAMEITLFRMVGIFVSPTLLLPHATTVPFDFLASKIVSFA
jgi:hypothetical protein